MTTSFRIPSVKGSFACFTRSVPAMQAATVAVMPAAAPLVIQAASARARRAIRSQHASSSSSILVKVRPTSCMAESTSSERWVPPRVVDQLLALIHDRTPRSARILL
jgi:hypothetical protein